VQTVAVKVDTSLTSGGTAATAPSCTGPAPLVPVPNAPHGIYVWNPYREGDVEKQMEQYVLGPSSGPVLDRDFCGASIVVDWTDVEPSKGNFTWSTVDSWIATYARPGLHVNLLFANSAEECAGQNYDPCLNDTTPSFVFSDIGGQPIVCPSQPPYPVWTTTAFETDYEAFIDRMIKRFSSGGDDPYTAYIGYMRFGIGAGVEAYPGHIESATAKSHPCLDAWQAATGAPFSLDNWLQYTLDIVTYLSQRSTDKQLMISLNYVSAYDASNPDDTYTYSDAVAAGAAPRGIAMGAQNLGLKGTAGVDVAAANATPAACDPTAQNANLFWCQPYMRHVGVVPFEFQPIVSPILPGMYSITIAHIFQYGLDNNAQIFEIYPQDWVFKDDPSEYPNFTAATQADYNAAFAATSLVLGRNH
jgi:hypothetical protein